MLKTIAEFCTLYEAEIFKARLESEGINAVIMNSNSPYPGITMGEAGIKVQVNDYDLESAQMILDTDASSE